MGQRNGRLITHKFYQYLGPSLLYVMAMQLGSLASGVVVGQFLGASSLTSASLSICIVYLAQLPALAIPVGLSIVVAKLLSERKFLEARKTVNSTLVFGLLLTSLFIPVGLFLTPYIASFLAGGFPEYIPLISDYISVFFYSAPFYFVALFFCNLIAADNHPGLSSLYFIISTLVHIGVELLFCLYLPEDHILLYVAISIPIGLLAGFVVAIPYFLSKSRLLKYGFSPLYFKCVIPVLKSSLTPLLSYGLQCLLFFLLMKTASSAFTSTGEMNSYTILCNLVTVLDVFSLSLIQMFPPLVSSLSGEKDYSGIRYIVKKVLTISLISTSALVAATLIYPDMYLYLFGFDPSFVSSDYGLAVRLYAMGFLFYMLNKFIQSYYPSLLANAPSLLNIVLEKGAAGIPLTISLMFALGAKGYSLGISLAEILSFLLTVLFLVYYSRKKKGTKSLFLLPEDDKDHPRYELTVSSLSEVEETVNLVQREVLSLGGSPHSASFLALAAEELLTNCFQYGYPLNKKDWGVDILLTQEGSSFILSLKDDGVSFNPLTHAEEEGPTAAFHGLPLLKKVASRLEYVRILNLNQTIVEMDG